jgi:hypothetical protein
MVLAAGAAGEATAPGEHRGQTKMALPIITGPLQPGVARIVNPETKEELGFVFTEANEGGQIQRWLLYQDPQNSLETTPAPAPMVGFDLAAWQAFVITHWSPGNIYVRAQANVYFQGQTYGGVIWNQIPARPQLPMPVFPGSPNMFQVDFSVQGIEIIQDRWHGRVFAEGRVDEPTSIEYWSLPTGYQAAGLTAQIRIRATPEAVPTLDVFIELANQNFGPGSAFVITGCANYQGDVPPASL